MDRSQSALIVAVPEADPVVGRHRDRLDQAAAWGVPAHITICYPFLAPELIDEQVLAGLRQAAATVPAFSYRLNAVNWFGERVVWLAPAPCDPLIALTVAVTARFPAVRPYDGQFDEIVPHLTVGHDKPVADLKTAAADIAEHLPIAARITSMRLATGCPEPGHTWSTLAEFPLG
ncbi:2'-5' RNA ligase family protein [Actinoplanes solisilvae]|uniref:2'-5' RNA ligase family protein n=1 Tax=Actinoplanes solisilvae TaxID=2486853 RepID=UPI000FD9E384|nr:2'-5' RNA ligase family protein [Actinoplanes solisilvae]